MSSNPLSVTAPRRYLPRPVQWVLAGRSGTAQGSQVFLTSLLLMAVNLATGIFTARILGPSGRGELAAITVWPQALAGLATLGVPAAVVYYFRIFPRDRGKLLTAALLLSLGQGLAVAAIGIAIVAPATVAHYGGSILSQAQTFMLFAPVALIGLVVVAALQGRLDFRSCNLVAAAPPLLALCGLLGLMATHHLTVLTAALAAMLPSLAVIAWVAYHLSRAYGVTIHGLRPWLKRLLSYGSRAYLLDLIGTFAATIDQAIVIGFVGPAALGWYVIALRSSRIVNTLQQSVAPVLFSRAAGRSRDEVAAITGRSVRVTMSVATVGAAVAAVASPQILSLVYGKSYLPATGVFRLLILEALLSGAAWVLGQAFFALGRPGTVAAFQAIGLGVLTALLLILVPHLGILGAGLALVASTTLRLIFLLAGYPLFLGISPPSFVLRREDLAWIGEAIRF